MVDYLTLEHWNSRFETIKNNHNDTALFFHFNLNFIKTPINSYNINEMNNIYYLVFQEFMK